MFNFDETTANVFEIITKPLVTFVQALCPFLSLYALLIKIQNLGTDIIEKDLQDWTLGELILIAGFFNQITGMRILANVERDAMQQFVFAGNNGLYDRYDLTLVNGWWDVLLTSVFTNIGLTTFELMVLWFKQDPVSLQLILKNKDNAIESEKLIQEMNNHDNRLLREYSTKIIHSLELDDNGSDSFDAMSNI